MPRDFVAEPVQYSISRPPIDAVIAAAERAVGNYVQSFVAARNRNRDLQLAALGSIYAARSALQEESVFNALLRRKQVRVHGNIKNRDALLVQAFFRNTDPELTAQRCKWGALLSYAADRDVKPDAKAFADFIKREGGILEAYKAWCGIKSQPQNKIAQARVREERVSAVLKQTPQQWHSSCAATRDAAGIRTGLNLAVLQIKPDGSFMVVRVLHRSHQQVVAIMGNR